jgi:hypothetical protein
LARLASKKGRAAALLLLAVLTCRWAWPISWDALSKHPELRGAFMTLKSAEAYAPKAIGDPLSRTSFMRETRASITGTLPAGKDVRDPAMKTKQRADRER